MISAIYKQGQGGTTGRFCTEAAATARKQLFLIGNHVLARR
jgi:hypothetical protein